MKQSELLGTSTRNKCKTECYKLVVSERLARSTEYTERETYRSEVFMVVEKLRIIKQYRSVFHRINDIHHLCRFSMPVRKNVDVGVHNL